MYELRLGWVPTEFSVWFLTVNLSRGSRSLVKEWFHFSTASSALCWWYSLAPLSRSRLARRWPMPRPLQLSSAGIAQPWTIRFRTLCGQSGRWQAGFLANWVLLLRTKLLRRNVDARLREKSLEQKKERWTWKDNHEMLGIFNRLWRNSGIFKEISINVVTKYCCVYLYIYDEILMFWEHIFVLMWLGRWKEKSKIMEYFE